MNLEKQNLPKTNLLFLIFGEILSYFRLAVLTPLIMFYGLAIFLAVFTIWSLFTTELSWGSLPFRSYIPESFKIDQITILQIWGSLAFIFYLIRSLVEKITHGKFYVSYMKRLGLQILALTALYLIIVVGAYMRLGWFFKGDDITTIMILLYIVSLLLTLIIWTMLIPFDLILFFLRRMLVSQSQQVESVALPWKRDGFVERLVCKVVDRLTNRFHVRRSDI